MTKSDLVNWFKSPKSPLVVLTLSVVYVCENVERTTASRTASDGFRLLCGDVSGDGKAVTATSVSKCIRFNRRK